MGRRILKSLRRSSQESKPPDVKIEVDDGTVFQVNGNNTVFVTANQDGGANRTVGADDEISELTTNTTKTESERQVYVPPKIWGEDFDSESENEVQQEGSWWSSSSPSKRRQERRDSIAHAAKLEEERDESSDFCGVFDCGGGAHEEEPAVRGVKYDLEDELCIQEEPAHSSIDERPTNLSTDNRPTNSPNHERSPSSSSHPSSSSREPEILMISALSDSLDNGATETDTVDDGQEEGVEHTVDAFWTQAAKGNDLDLERKNRRKRIMKKKKLLQLKRRKRRKQRKEKDLVASPECDDNETIKSTESTSTNGDSTIISIKHVISDVDCVEGPEERAEHSESNPSDESTADALLMAKDSLQVDSTSREVPVMEESNISEDSPSASSRASSHTYESLSRGASDEDREDIVTKTVQKDKSSDSVLNRVFEVVEAGANLLAFPEIPKPRTRRTRSGKRVKFAPDVKFNDTYEDYSLDYSYSDPEFDDRGSYEEDTYHIADDEECHDDDEGAFFDDEPTPKSASTSEPTSVVPQTNADDESELFNDVETSESSDEQYVYDAHYTILDFEDNEPEDLVGRVSSESGFGYFNQDADDEDSDTGDEASVNEPSSSHKTVEGMQMTRHSAPLNHAKETSGEAIHPSPNDTMSSEDEQAAPARGLDRIDSEDEIAMIDDADEAFHESCTSYKSFEEMKSAEEAPSFVVSEETNEPSLYLNGNERASEHSESTTFLYRGGSRYSNKRLKTPAKTLNDIDRPEATAQADCGKADTMQSVTDERNTYQNEHAQKEISANSALVERYLLNANPNSEGAWESSNRAVQSNRATQKAEMKTTVGSPLKNKLSSEENVGECVNDAVEKNSSRSTAVDKREECTDWRPAETRESQPALQDFENKTAFAREGWPSSSSLSTIESTSVADGLDSAETRADLPAGDWFSNANEDVADQLEAYRKRLRYGARISDKKESLKLSLQGFARAPKNTSNWANFNNAPFQDLETVPFDEL